MDGAYNVGLSYLSQFSRKAVLAVILLLALCSFGYSQHIISATSGSNGSISPTGDIPVADGTDQSFTITPDANYHVLDVLVDDVSVGAVTDYTFNNVTAAHTISATFERDYYPIDASAGVNGSVTPSGITNVDHGSNQAYTIDPDEGYHVLDVLVDDVSVGAVTGYTFNNVTAAHTISATFEINTYAIDASAGANGSISSPGITNVNHGSNQAYTISPDANYHVLDVLVDDVSVGAVTGYTFNNVTAAHTISATFERDYYPVDASAGVNGSISSPGITNVDHGSNQAYTITPDANYHVLDVLVDDVSVGAVTGYTFNNVTAPHTISATFERDYYPIDASAGVNGSVTPSGITNVDHGSNQAYTIDPDEGYHVLDVLVDDVSVGAVTGYTFNNVTAAHTISATFEINTYAIDASAGANGSISSPGITNVNHGSNQAYTITPDANYHVLDVLVDDVSVGAVTDYTFNNVTAAHTISATFERDYYPIDASAGVNGSVTPSGITNVDHGSNQAYTIDPDEGYHVLDVLVDDVSVGAVTGYTFNNVTAAHTISATFEINTYAIDASAGANGSISSPGITNVNHGSNQAYTITPDANYHVLDVLVDDVSVGAVTGYTFNNVTAAHTISATFERDYYPIDASAGVNGAVTPSGTTNVDHGSNQAYSITPDANYHVLDVLVDDVSVGAVTGYTFNNVTAPHTISATFEIDNYPIVASTGPNGAVTPPGTTDVDHGSDQIYAITPDANYHVLDVLVNGVSVGAVTGYTFNNVIAAHTISATFERDYYPIDASAGANGSISSPGITNVDHGSNQAYTITPDANYHVLDVLVDDVSVGAVTGYTFNNVTATHTISATFERDYYPIDASVGANGSISSPGITNVDHGSSQAYTITPDANYHVLDVLVDDVSVGAVTGYTFNNVTAPHTISATFEIDNYPIDASSGPNGAVTPPGTTDVDHGSDQVYAITPDANYHVLDVLVNGVSVGAVTGYTFNNVIAAHTISATFERDYYPIDASAGANGSISSPGITNVDHGSTQAYSITPDANYHVLDVLVDDVSVGAVTGYTFNNVTAPHTISATFEIDNYPIVASTGPNGAVTPSGTTDVDHGSDQVYAITPAANYHVLDVLVDDVSVGAVTGYTFNNVTAAHTISATFERDYYPIDASAGANGSISSPGITNVDHGSSQAYTITPDANYHVLDVLVDDVSVGAVTGYTFNNVTAPHTISATFEIDNYPIDASSGPNGNVTPSGTTDVDHGSDQAYTITPDANYHVLDVLVDDVSVGAVTGYTFNNVTAAHTISATFELDFYPITSSAGANGTIAPEGITDVDHGTSQAYTITPSLNYHILDVLVDGVSVGAVTDYTFSSVTVPHTISATFERDYYPITASAGAFGGISPSGITNVDHGLSQPYTIIPAENYHVLDVLVDGVSVGAVTNYIFTNVTEPHTISATFEIDNYPIVASAGPNGAVTPSGTTDVDHGSDQVYAITPAANYHVLDVLVDDVSVGAVTGYTFNNVTAAHTISATFERDYYPIDASAGANGSISSPGITNVDHGSNQAYTITPDANYHVLDVLVDDVSVGAVTGYTFNNVTAPHTISATFEIDNYPIVASAGPNGAVTPSGTTDVDHGSDQVYTITPAANYHVLDVLVDDVSVGAVTGYTFNNVIASHTISATFERDYYPIDASAGANGSISSPGITNVDHGSNQAYTITPDANYHVLDVLVDDVSVGAVTGYTFNNVTAPHTISATFEIDNYPIVASTGPNGAVTPSGTTDVDHGSDQVYAITPAANYHVLDVLVDGASVGAVTGYTFNNVTAAHTISATFERDYYPIDASAGANGSISSPGITNVDHGSNQAYTITPDANYHVLDVLVDGSSVGALTNYTFTNVTAPHTISATFELDYYPIVASSGPNGVVTPSGTTNVDHGSGQVYTITPATNYHILDVLVDGSSVGVVSNYTFTNVTTSHTISATFEIDNYPIDASAGPNGSISPPGTTNVDHGWYQSYIITPDLNYHILDVLVDGINVGAFAGYTFTSVTAPHTISATFELDYYPINASAGPNGSISPPGTTNVDHGFSQAYNITPALNYHILDVMVDGVSVGAVTDYTFTDVTVPHTISATFERDYYPISASPGPYGGISPPGITNVDHGFSQVYTIIPAQNYHVLDVLVDGLSVGAVTDYTFTNVIGPHTISATFEIDNYPIVASTGPNGDVTPLGTTNVDHGSNLVYSITPDANYHVLDVLVDGLSVGAVTGYTFNNVTAAHTISATFEIDNYPIIASSGPNGGVTPPGTTDVDHGSSQVYAITPAANYHVLDVLVDGSSVGAVTGYTFTNVTGPHTINATFEIDNYPVVSSAGPNGSITPSGTIDVDHGSSQVYTITPAANYHVLDVLVDGSSVGAVSGYTFTNVTAPHSISATFEIDYYPIDASAGANGGISPPGTTNVDHGSNMAYTITPLANYHVVDVLVDGVSVGAVTGYTFNNVTASHTISVTFEIDNYPIVASTGPNGNVTPPGITNVDHGSNLVYTITPAANYHVLDVLVDGSSVGAVSGYTFTNVTAPHTISATFEIDNYPIIASTGTNGNITPPGTTNVDHGSNQVYNILPSANYHVLDVLVDGISVGAVTDYTFSNVTGPHTISATFEIDNYPIDASAGPNGSISPPGTTIVDHGSSQTYTIAPVVNYHILDVQVDGISVGVVTEYTFTNVTRSHTINVSFEIDNYPIVASPGPFGGISPPGTTNVDHGLSQPYAIIPAENYHVLDVLVDGSSVGAVTDYTFTNVTGPHTISATFEIDNYPIDASTGPNGSISPPGTTNVDHGSGQVYTITPALNYHVLDVLVDGLSVGAVTDYTFTNVTGPRTISATFEIDNYPIVASTGPNGGVTPPGTTNVDHGSDLGYTITADLNYHILDVLVDGISVGAVTDYTFTNVTAPHTISAIFEIDNYPIVASTGPNGGVTPPGTTNVDHGSNQSFAITPVANYHVLDVLVDGISVGAVTGYTFTNVTAPHTISATFEIDNYPITASAGANGAIAPEGITNVDHGSGQAYTITPALNYHVLDVLVDGLSIGAVTGYTFTNVTAPHTISATFEIDNYPITATTGTNGGISPPGVTNVDHGSDQTYNIAPDEGYHILDVLVDGLSIGAVSNYAFTNVISPHTISATFEINTYTIDASTGANGSISPPGTTVVDHGSNLALTINPVVGYHVLDVLVDGSSVGAVTDYTFTNVTAPHTISATFEINTYIISASNGVHGNITPWGSVGVDHGSSQTFTSIPDVGYNLANVSVDGANIGAVTPYSFNNVTGPHTIYASFIKHVEVLSVSIPNASMKIGDVISATIRAVTDVGIPYTLLSGSIGGYPLSGLQRLNSTTYLANFVVTEGGSSFTASQDIPVSNLRITDGTVQSPAYNLSIVQGNDPLDGRVPVISSMSIESGLYKIGDVVRLNIDSDGTGYAIHPASRINGIQVTVPHVSFSEQGSGNYRISYTIQEGDTDVDYGDLTASIILVKPSGNSNLPYSTIGNRNLLALDAHRPRITRLEVPSIEVGPGRTVQVTVTADGTGYSFVTGTVINNVPLSSPRLTSSDLSGNLYEVSYVVSDPDIVVAPGDLKATMLMVDPAGNISAPYSILLENNLEIYTERPMAILAGVPEICRGESAELSIFLQGRGPWRLDLHDGTESTRYSSVTDSVFNITVSPDVSATYSILSLWDRNNVWKTGTGSLDITVYEKTDVNITDLDLSYSVESGRVELNADVPGGIFSGPGVVNATGFFYPAIADTVDSPHSIYYTYINENGCTSVDSTLVFVLGAEGDIYLPGNRYCNDSESFIVQASNVAGVNGTFTLLNSDDQKVTGLTDHGDNSATIEPGQLVGGGYTIEYEYLDNIYLYLRAEFLVEFIPEPVINTLEQVYCQNEAPVLLLTDNANAVFEGPGVSGDLQNGYFFDPANADIGSNSITCTVTGEYGCSRSVQEDVTVHYVPEVNFSVTATCIPQVGGIVQFNNLTGDKTLVETWAWNFDDPGSGINNSSDLLEPAHFYVESGSRSVGLTATTFEGCTESHVADTMIGFLPEAKFTWMTDCYIDNSGTEFLNRSIVDPADIESMVWEFRSGNGDFLGEESSTSLSDTITFEFSEVSSYEVVLHITSLTGCADSIFKEVAFSPIVQLEDLPYLESFDVTNGLWTVHSTNEVESWIWEEPEFTDFVQTSGDKAWFTQLPSDVIGYEENSWIQSPCFDFSEVEHPIIHFDMMRSFVPILNGAVLQYQDNIDEGWKTLGSETPGVNWYNSTNLRNRPGGSSIGWGLDVFNPDTVWVRTSHDLDEIQGNRHVKLRIAIANNGAQGIGNQGFAFDNLMITEHSKYGILEYFTNSSDSTSVTVDHLIDSICKSSSIDFIDIQYHTSYPGSDPMNENNPHPASTRSFYYGVPQVPYAIIDGGPTDQFRYDFSSLEELQVEDQIIVASLDKPEFDVDLSLTWWEDRLEAVSTVTCIAEEYEENIQLYVVIVESEVTSYSGVDGKTTFRNVVLDMLPTPAGKLLGNNWLLDSSKTHFSSWIYEDYVEDLEDLIVVAFIQDRTTGRILQSTVEYFGGTTNVGRETMEMSSIHVYPNPAKNSFYINLGIPLENQSNFRLLDINGRIVRDEQVPPGHQIYEVGIQELDRGIYILLWYESGQIRGINKIIKTE